MSDDVLSVIPTDPQWQPDQAAAERAAALAADLAPGLPDGVDVEIDVTWYDALTPVDCGGNLERIGCPHCGASVDTDWYADLLGSHGENGFATLAVEVPCCGVGTSLDVLHHDWPCGWFGEEELAAIGDALGHPVRQIRAHI